MGSRRYNSVTVGFDKITNIDALHFVDDQSAGFPGRRWRRRSGSVLPADQIGTGQVSPTLAVDGSTTASPHSSNEIDIFSGQRPYRPHAGEPQSVGLDLHPLEPHQNEIRIDTNDAVALNDHIVGTRSPTTSTPSPVTTRFRAAAAPTTSMAATATTPSSTD